MLVNSNLRRQVSQRISRSIFFNGDHLHPLSQIYYSFGEQYPFSRICKMTTPPSLVDSDASSSFLAGALLLPKNCPFIPTYCGTYSALHIALFISNLLFYRPKELIYFKQLMRQHNGCFYKESVSLSLWVRRMGLEISGRGSAKR